MRHSLGIKQERVRLSPLQVDDIEKMRILRNKHRTCFVFSGEISRESQEQWYKNYLVQPTDYMFSVFYQNHWVGAVAIYNVDEKKQQAEYGRLLIDHEATDVRGLGVDATRAACSIAMSKLGLQSVVLEVYADNAAAQITYLKAGFQPESVFYDTGGRKMLRMRFEK